MIHTKASPSASDSLPPLVLASAAADRLRGVALAAMRDEPEVAEQLLAELERAEVVSPEAMPSTAVTIGSWITYQDMASGSIRTIQLVLPEDVDPATQRVSIISPIGAALIGLTVGQVMTWQLREGLIRQLTVLNVSDAPVLPARSGI